MSQTTRGEPLAGTDTQVRDKPQSRQLPPFNVLLHNDDVNEMGYVVRTIMELTALTRAEAAERMLEAHHRGKTVLLTTHKERAELYCEQFASKGLTATAEPA
jgi:ATP-dependent Clp protease adaptor protein ClpS